MEKDQQRTAREMTELKNANEVLQKQSKDLWALI